MSDSDDEDWQRIRNGLTTKMWVTDKEMEAIAPVFGVLIVIAAVIGGLIWLFS